MIVSNDLRIEIGELTDREWKKLYKELTFVNASGEVVENFRIFRTKGYVRLPRGAWYLLPNHVRYRDRRVCPEMPKLKFKVKLNDLEKDPRYRGQEEAVLACLEHEQGLILRPPGTGKTQILLSFAARCRTRVIVLVHTEDILQQWVEYAQKAIPELEGNIGIIGSGKYSIGQVTIATIQTLHKYIGNKPKSWWAQFGAVLIDEAHHAAAPSWAAVINQFPARYRIGVTASPTRADGNHPSMRYIIGPVIHRQKFSSPVPLKVELVKTEFRFGYRGRHDWTRMVTALTQDNKRNKMIAARADKEIAKGNSVLILSRRIDHLHRIAALMENEVEVLAAATRTKGERKDVLAGFRSGRVECVLATQLADEALDVPRLNRVFLTHPGKHEGRIIQQIGRSIRKHPDKKDALVLDFVDRRVGILRRQADKRKRTYRKEGISIKKKKGRIAWR